MDLWLVIYAGAHIGGAAGPLPYDMAECERRRDEFRALQSEVIATGYSKEQKRYATPDEMANIKAMRFECEYRPDRPVLGSPA